MTIWPGFSDVEFQVSNFQLATHFWVPSRHPCQSNPLLRTSAPKGIFSVRWGNGWGNSSIGMSCQSKFKSTSGAPRRLDCFVLNLNLKCTIPSGSFAVVKLSSFNSFRFISDETWWVMVGGNPIAKTSEWRWSGIPCCAAPNVENSLQSYGNKLTLKATTNNTSKTFKTIITINYHHSAHDTHPRTNADIPWIFFVQLQGNDHAIGWRWPLQHAINYTSTCSTLATSWPWRCESGRGKNVAGVTKTSGVVI